MVAVTVFHGTESEAMALVSAIAYWCDKSKGCYFELGKLKTMCASHEMMLKDQRALDGLLFIRRTVDRLYREEGLA